ncbi:MAG TPA: 3-oxoacyl-[acyl-carrier-protein] synthase III C-terminal domain-containing protein [Alphaproteobacteria bacterium]|nr:3-oxoacyl-[acyl-carrier-protein] synthase III C-terminal domain-containing protein [Alphaproteobacteria bacterium]
MNVAAWAQPPAPNTLAPLATIAGVASALPPHRYEQAAITEAVKQLWHGKLDRPELLDRLHARAKVAHRHLALPIERYAGFSDWGAMNATWIEHAQQLGAQALDEALERAGLRGQDLDALFVVSITGVASPSLDARIINRLRLRPDIKRTPIFGVGCVGGALALSRAADYTLAYPHHTAAVVSVELCSLTFRRDDLSAANLVSSGLFGDGAAAVVLAGPAAAPARDRGAARAPRILATQSVFYEDTEQLMGWDISGQGFKIVLSPHLPELIRAKLAHDVDAFLALHGLCRGDLGTWVIHTGGPKVLLAVQDALSLRDDHLAPSWESLERVGNLSSASVLLVLEDVNANRAPRPGTLGMLLALGPGFCSELILLQW